MYCSPILSPLKMFLMPPDVPLDSLALREIRKLALVHFADRAKNLRHHIVMTAAKDTHLCFHGRGKDEDPLRIAQWKFPN